MSAKSVLLSMTIKPRSPWPSGVFSRDPSSLTMHFQYLPAVCRVVICNYTFFPAFCCISKPLCCSPNSTEGSGAQIIKFLSSSSPKIVLGKHSRCHRDHNSIPWISLLFSTIMHATSICDSHLEPEVLPGTALNHQQEGVWERNAPAFFFFLPLEGPWVTMTGALCSLPELTRRIWPQLSIAVTCPIMHCI